MNAELYTMSGTGKITTYNWLFRNARISLEAAQATEEGQFFNSMNVLVFSAFAMESFFNHLGSHLDDEWEKKERRINKYDKLRNFHKDLNIQTSISEEPYTVIFDVFDFRDALAHGRTEEVEKTELIELTEDESRSYMIGSKWSDSCTLESAEKVFSATEAVISELFKAAGLGNYPFLHYHSSVYSRA